MFGEIDPLMALGTSTPLFNTLGHWQRIDLPAELARSSAMPAGTALAAVPLNLIPHIRAAVASQIANPTDRITMDVIALLFDYVFRDPSIPDAMRRIFGRLQVPGAEGGAARPHVLLRPLARRRGGCSTTSRTPRSAPRSNPDYEEAFAQHASAVVERVCRDFEIDVAVFATGDLELAAFIEAERKATEAAVKPDVAQALATEAREEDRAEVLALTRDKLAGLDLPFEVRGFVETTWTDYLTKLWREKGAESPEWAAAVRHARRPAVEHRGEGAHRPEGAPDQDDPRARAGAAQGLRRRGRAGRQVQGLLRRALSAARGRDQASAGRSRRARRRSPSRHATPSPRRASTGDAPRSTPATCTTT